MVATNKLSGISNLSDRICLAILPISTRLDRILLVVYQHERFDRPPLPPAESYLSFYEAGQRRLTSALLVRLPKDVQWRKFEPLHAGQVRRIDGSAHRAVQEKTARWA